MTAGRICVRSVDLADAHESVQTAAQRMNSRNVGSLMVVDSDARPIGVITDRDLATRVVAKGLDANMTHVGDVMTKALEVASETMPIETLLSHMRAGPYRRLPVVDEYGKLVGMVTLDDVLDLLSEEFIEIGRLVRREAPAALAEL